MNIQNLQIGRQYIFSAKEKYIPAGFGQQPRERVQIYRAIYDGSQNGDLFFKVICQSTLNLNQQSSPFPNSSIDQIIEV